jgi:hypothetical protein
VVRQILLDPAELPLHRVSTLVRDQRLRVGEEGFKLLLALDSDKVTWVGSSLLPRQSSSEVGSLRL